ncbi:hypothetical protein PQX77_021203 [Marasmius sp. AFHP31]|nr:hypothetical protein PQX77_021203 [Marasmius sp. AFHP31]
MSLTSTTLTSTLASQPHDSITTFSTSVSNMPSDATLLATSPTSDIYIDPRIFSAEQLGDALNGYESSYIRTEDITNSAGRTISTDLIKPGASNPTMILCESVIDPSAKGIMQSLLSTSFLPERIPASAVQPVYGEDGQILEYRISTEFAVILKLKFQVIGAFVVGMANGLERLGVENCPLAIPRDVVDTGEWRPVYGYTDPVSKRNDTFPFIRLADPRVNNSFASLSFSCPAQAFDFFRDAEQAFDTLALWVVDSVRRSVSLGTTSLVNAGGPFFIPNTEYLQRVGRISTTQEVATTSNSQGMELVLHPVHSSRAIDPSSHLSLILHPLYSNAVLDGALEPYDPKEPGFNRDIYTPSAYLTKVSASDFGMEGTLGLKRKRAIEDVGGRGFNKKVKQTGGVM